MSKDGSIPVNAGCSIALHFSLALNNGEVIDSNFDAMPATFRLGDGNMLPGFEQVLLGLRAGESVETSISPDRAFGEVNSSNSQTFPIDKLRNLLDDELLPAEVGTVIAFKDPAGFDLPGVVKSISEETIVVDFNHPLAGKTIVFKASIVAVMAADEEAVEI